MAKDNRKVSIENDWRNLLYTELKRTGGDPSFLFEILEGIIEQRAWETLQDDSGEPVGSLRRLIEAPLPVGCGQKVDKVLRLLQIEHRYEDDGTQWKERMKALRENINTELKIEQQEQETEIPALNEHGTNQHSEDVIKKSYNVQNNRGTSRTHRIAVLKRDAPDLAERVIRGELSAAAGMRELRKAQGKPEKPRGAVNFLNAESARDTLIKYMPTDVLHELIDLLNEWNDESTGD
jgi:hypothetical protein